MNGMRGNVSKIFQIPFPFLIRVKCIELWSTQPILLREPQKSFCTEIKLSNNYNSRDVKA